MEYLMVNGSIVLIHQHGASKEKHEITKPLENQEVD